MSLYVYTISFSHLVFFNDPATTEIYTLSLHDALPIWRRRRDRPTRRWAARALLHRPLRVRPPPRLRSGGGARFRPEDRKSTRLNSSHTVISYAVFCLKKKKKKRKMKYNHK